MANLAALLLRNAWRLILVICAFNGFILAVLPKSHIKLPWWIRITPIFNVSYGPYGATNHFPVPVLAARIVGVIYLVVALIFLFGLPAF
jgi:hypothetical protein